MLAPPPLTVASSEDAVVKSPLVTEAYCAPLLRQLAPLGSVRALPEDAARLSQPPVIEV